MSAKTRLIFSLFLVIVGGVFVIVSIRYHAGISKADTDDEELIEQAKQAVGELVLPPKPAGRIQTVTETREVKVKIPVIKWKITRIGPVSTKVPQSTTETRFEKVNVQVAKFTDAPQEEVDAWNKSVGVDEELIAVGSPADLDITLEGLPLNATIEIAVSAVNNGGESAKTEVVTIQTT